MPSSRWRLRLIRFADQKFRYDSTHCDTSRNGPGMIEVLPSAGLVLADRLDPRRRRHIDGNRPPGRRNPERGNAIDLSLARRGADRLAGSNITISEPGLHPAKAKDAVRLKFGNDSHECVLPGLRGAVPDDGRISGDCDRRNACDDEPAWSAAPVPPNNGARETGA